MYGRVNGIGLEVLADGRLAHEGTFCNGRALRCGRTSPTTKILRLVLVIYNILSPRLHQSARGTIATTTAIERTSQR
jgi:hypothetical protein